MTETVILPTTPSRRSRGTFIPPLLIFPFLA